jgi:hypothetical protein
MKEVIDGYQQDPYFKSILRMKLSQERLGLELKGHVGEIDNTRYRAQMANLQKDSLVWKRSQRFELRQGLLYHKGLLCVPRCLRQRLLHQVHDTLAGGHVGGDKMQQAILRNYSWLRMCPSCL